MAAMTLKRRIVLSLKSGAIALLLLIVIGGILPPMSPLALAVSRCFEVGGILTDRLGMGGHDLATYPVVFAVDVLLYSCVVLIAVTAWTGAMRICRKQ